jgi:hypothetical protein
MFVQKSLRKSSADLNYNFLLLSRIIFIGKLHFRFDGFRMLMSDCQSRNISFFLLLTYFCNTEKFQALRKCTGGYFRFVLDKHIVV